MVWAQKTFVPRDGLHAHSHCDPCSFLDFMLVNSCVQVPLDKHRVSWKTVAIKYNCIAAHLRTCKLVFNKLEGQISCKSAPPTLCPYGVGGTWNISGSKEITIISQDMYSASANFLSTARSPLWEVLAAVHYSAMLLHWLAPALFTDRGVCLLPAGAGLLWSSLLNTLHRATQQLGPQHPQQLRVRSHCLGGNNRSVFRSCVSHFAPADLLCIPAGAGVYHEEQNEQPSWSLCLCEKQRLPAAALICALTVDRNWCVHVGTDDPVFGIWKILGYMKVNMQSSKYLWNYKISEKNPF